VRLEAGERRVARDGKQPTMTVIRPTVNKLDLAYGPETDARFERIARRVLKTVPKPVEKQRNAKSPRREAGKHAGHKR
jgi:hypothetical protein